MEAHPFALVECNLYGPIKCGDRNGFEYLFAANCVGTGAVFTQPLRHKSEAATAPRAFAKWVRTHQAGIEITLCLRESSMELGVCSTDRGGEFTTTWGATKSEFDEAAEELFRDAGSVLPALPSRLLLTWGTSGGRPARLQTPAGLPSEWMKT